MARSSPCWLCLQCVFRFRIAQEKCVPAWRQREWQGYSRLLIFSARPTSSSLLALGGGEEAEVVVVGPDCLAVLRDGALIAPGT
jgi:hypothetical protein